MIGSINGVFDRFAPYRNLVREGLARRIVWGFARTLQTRPLDAESVAQKRAQGVVRRRYVYQRGSRVPRVPGLAGPRA